MPRTNFHGRILTSAITALLCCGASAASAQDKIYKLELSQQALNVIATALGKQPYADVAATFAELQRQIAPQQDPPPSPPARENHK